MAHWLTEENFPDQLDENGYAQPGNVLKRSRQAELTDFHANKRQSFSPAQVKGSATVEVIDLTDDNGTLPRQNSPQSPSYGQQYRDEWEVKLGSDGGCDLDPRNPSSSSLAFEPAPQQDIASRSFKPAPVQDTSTPASETVRNHPDEFTTNSSIAEPSLCKEQADLVDLILSGHNVFYTGSAGCGKSTVLKAFVKRLRKQGRIVHILAPTGRAALDVRGMTTWSYAGWTPDHHKKTLKELRDSGHKKSVNRRLRETEVLIFDEISMVENLHFERLNELMKSARGKPDDAFGGVQLVVTGDFCQLPPVTPFRHCIECGRELIPNGQSTEYKCRLHGTYYDIDKWAFRSKAWTECNFRHVNLTQIHRQSDQEFIGILNKCRNGQGLSPADENLLLNHHSETRNAIKLFSTRAEVKRINDESFIRLRSRARAFRALDNFVWREQHPGLQGKSQVAADGSLLALREHRFDFEMQLKQGMLVVLLVNLDIHGGLVNGSQGVIQRWEPYDPAKLPKAEKNIGRGEDHFPTGMDIMGGEHAVYRETQIKEYASRVNRRTEWPVVRFLNGVERTIYADCTVNELGDEEPRCLLSRTQIPLMAAWAMTIHKSQGMTLNRVIVDLSKNFEEGQVYVALSRARSLDGLKVLALGKTAGKGNPEVKLFLKEKFGIV